MFNRLTLTQQWISATLLALLPLVVAVIYASEYLSKQAQTQRDMVVSIDELNNLEAHISGQVTDIERSTRQYLLLRNPKFFDLFGQNISAFNLLQGQLASRLRDSEAIYSLQRTIAQIQQHLILDVSSAIEHEPVFALLQQANMQVRALNGEVDKRVQDMLDQSDRQFQTAMRQLMLIGVLAVPGTILLVILSSVAIARPVWRMVHAIRRLGHGHWQEPIYIGGPADLRSLGASLEWMRNRLETSEKQKQAFLRHVTHELKTPLAAIMEAGSLLLDEVPGKVSRGQKQVVQILMANADNLQALIQQLLNYNAVAHGMLNAEAEVDIAAVCNKIRNKLMDSRPSSDCVWSIEGESVKLTSDPQAIEMILSNLLSNAHDFTPESGKVAVRWGIDGAFWWLSVADNGPGLEESERKNIFKPFYQGKARRRGPLQGTGLGLAIVQECVAHLHGTIDVVSGEEGSEFMLKFPLRRELLL